MELVRASSTTSSATRTKVQEQIRGVSKWSYGYVKELLLSAPRAPKPIFPSEVNATTGTEFTTTAVSEASPVLRLSKNLYISPGMRIDYQSLELWNKQIGDRLAAELRYSCPKKVFANEFIMAGRRRDCLRASILITCSGESTVRRVRKAVKSMKWLKDFDVPCAVIAETFLFYSLEQQQTRGPTPIIEAQLPPQVVLSDTKRQKPLNVLSKAQSLPIARPFAKADGAGLPPIRQLSTFDFSPPTQQPQGDQAQLWPQFTTIEQDKVKPELVPASNVEYQHRLMTTIQPGKDSGKGRPRSLRFDVTKSGPEDIDRYVRGERTTPGPLENANNDQQVTTSRLMKTASAQNVQEETKAVGQVQATPPAAEGNTVAAAEVGGSDGTEPAVANQDDTIGPERWRCEFPHLFPPPSDGLPEVFDIRGDADALSIHPVVGVHANPIATMRPQHTHDSERISASSEVGDEGMRSPGTPSSPVDEVAADVLSVYSLDVPSLWSGSTLSSVESTEPIIESVDKFTWALLADETLRSLYTVACDSIGFERFERNFARLLTLYASDLRIEARSPFEFTAVKVVGRHARYIAGCIRRKLDPHGDQSQTALHRMLAQGTTGTRVKDFLDGLEIGDEQNLGGLDDGNELDDEAPEWVLDYGRDDDTDEGDTDSQKSRLVRFELVKEFLLHTTAFAKLKENFREFVLPKPNINPVQAEVTVEELPNWTSDISGFGVAPSRLVPEPSSTDLFKDRVEKLVGQSLIWWPFAQPIRRCPDEWYRTSWVSGCGAVLYFDVPYDQNGPLRLNPAGSGSQRGTGPIIPMHNLPTTSPQVPGGSAANSGGTANSNIIPPAPSGQTRSGQNRLSQIPRTTPESYLHFCVDEDESTTRLADVDARTINDYNFARRLLSIYSSLGRWRSWWTMTDCAGVRFKKFRRMFDNDNIIACGGEEFPPHTNTEYEYESFEPLQHFKLFLEAEIRHRIANLHCCRKRTPTKLLQHIPKKVPHKLGPTAGVEGYGMHTIANVALWRVMIVIFFSQIGSVAFAVWWLILHPGDLQNAFVPATMSLALLAIFRPAGRSPG